MSERGDLADGACSLIKGNGIEFVLWDAKRYTTEQLSTYVQNTEKRNKFPKTISKDIKYMLQFENNFKIKQHGGLKYYIFVTYDTSENDFVKARNSLKAQIKKTKNKNFLSKNIHICCINKYELIKMVDYLTQNNIFLHGNQKIFHTAFKMALRKNQGFFKFEEMKSTLDLNKTPILPTPEELRKQ